MSVCRVCNRPLRDGDEAWADDWKVITAEGVRTEIRYVCYPCGALTEPRPASTMELVNRPGTTS